MNYKNEKMKKSGEYIIRNVFNNLDNPPTMEKVRVILNLLIDSGDFFYRLVELPEPTNPLSKLEFEELEEQFQNFLNLKHRTGSGILGPEQQKKDTKWWERYRQKNELYYWNNTKKLFSCDNLPYSTIKTIDDDTDMIMSYLGNPNDNDSFERFGMVVGHVQSGKTSNYSALISKAADVGYKIIIVIAGSLNNLRNQTQNRIERSFIGSSDGKETGVGGLDTYNPSNAPICLTSPTNDFQKKGNEHTGSIKLDNTITPLVLVIKKNVHTLKNVNEWLKKQNSMIHNHSLLIIDDESDYASINTKKDEEDPTAINKGIRNILSHFNKKAYVAYTATPYANIFINHNAEVEGLGKDLFPRDFIYALQAPDNYLGAEKIFLDPDKKYLCEVKDYNEYLPLKHKKTQKITFLSNSLKEAIRLFCLNIAIRKLRNQTKEHNSMMIHISRFTNIHNDVFIETSKYLDELKQVVMVDGKKQKTKIMKEFLETFNKFLITDTQSFNWNETTNSLISIISSIQTREVHSKSRIPLEYDTKEQNNYIVVGGMSLSRGYTIEGLNISYFLRSTIYYDTLMQMGRWFGYRPGYADLCKVFMPSEISNHFANIIESTNELIYELEEMRENKQTPQEFGLAVKNHPGSSLQVTANNKLLNTKNLNISMSLNGLLKETIILNDNKTIIDKNNKITENFIAGLPTDHKEIRTKNHHLWTKISKDTVLDFVNDFKLYEPNEPKNSDFFTTLSRMPFDHIKEYIAKTNTTWDIALYNGNSNSAINIDGVEFGNYAFRNVLFQHGRIEFKNRNISAGGAEAIALPKDILEDLKLKDADKNRNEIRKHLKRPLLMLHLLEVNSDLTGSEIKSPLKISAFGISFPTSIKGTSKPISIQANSVYIEQLQKQLELEQDFDD